MGHSRGQHQHVHLRDSASLHPHGEGMYVLTPTTTPLSSCPPVATHTGTHPGSFSLCQSVFLSVTLPVSHSFRQSLISIATHSVSHSFCQLFFLSVTLSVSYSLCQSLISIVTHSVSHSFYQLLIPPVTLSANHSFCVGGVM